MRAYDCDSHLSRQGVWVSERDIIVGRTTVIRACLPYLHRGGLSGRSRPEEITIRDNISIPAGSAEVSIVIPEI